LRDKKIFIYRIADNGRSMPKPFTLCGFSQGRGSLKDEDGIVVRKHIRDRCNECFVPRCWLLSDPDDNGRMYLSRKYFIDEPANKKGRFVQIRQFLFQTTFHKSAPLMRHITTRCGFRNCINPAHYEVGNWQPSASDIEYMIRNNWITREQAHAWYGGGGNDEDTDTDAEPMASPPTWPLTMVAKR
jgi:hypothetical protein